MKTVISNDPAPIGERCFLCEEPLTPPWFKTGKFRMHTACRDLVREDFEATHRRRLINPKTANDNTPPMVGVTMENLGVVGSNRNSSAVHSKRGRKSVHC